MTSPQEIKRLNSLADLFKKASISAYFMCGNIERARDFNEKEIFYLEKTIDALKDRKRFLEMLE